MPRLQVTWPDCRRRSAGIPSWGMRTRRWLPRSEPVVREVPACGLARLLTGVRCGTESRRGVPRRPTHPAGSTSPRASSAVRRGRGGRQDRDATAAGSGSPGEHAASRRQWRCDRPVRREAVTAPRSRGWIVPLTRGPPDSRGQVGRVALPRPGVHWPRAGHPRARRSSAERQPCATVRLPGIDRHSRGRARPLSPE